MRHRKTAIVFLWLIYLTWLACPAPNCLNTELVVASLDDRLTQVEIHIAELEERRRKSMNALSRTRELRAKTDALIWCAISDSVEGLLKVEGIEPERIDKP